MRLYKDLRVVAKADSEAPTREGEERLTAADLGAAMAALACALNPAFVVIDTMLCFRSARAFLLADR